jgi:LAS superfamily LD-carboxypeptidase LdcB
MGGGRVPGPLGGGGAAVVTPEPTGSAALSLKDFKHEVMEQQIQHLLRKGRHFIAALPASELEVIEDKHKMRKPAAGKCRELLAEAREALKTAQAEGDERARQTESIVVHSAYRNFNQDGAAWQRAFGQHYEAMKKKKVGSDPLGPAALRYMVAKLIPLKAPPGYSNHSNGLAIDFGTTVGGVYYKSNSSTRLEWRELWFYLWLKKNAKRFGFKQLPSEEWHWDYIGD